jgi:hypothetical protein
LASHVLQLDTTRPQTKNACCESCCRAETLRGGGYVEAAPSRRMIGWLVLAAWVVTQVATHAALRRPIRSDCRDMLPGQCCRQMGLVEAWLAGILSPRASLSRLHARTRGRRSGSSPHQQTYDKPGDGVQQCHRRTRIAIVARVELDLAS